MPAKVDRIGLHQDPRKALRVASVGVLDRISPVQATKVGRLKVSIYGEPKRGKTRLACTFPKPLLIIGAEDGTASVVGVPGIDFVLLDHPDEFGIVVDGPVRNGKYATVVVDTATRLRDLVIADVTGVSAHSLNKSWQVIKRDEWMLCAARMKSMLGPLLDLPRGMPLNVVIVAQEQVYTSGDDNDSGSSHGDSIQPVVGSALGKAICQYVNAECDYIGQCFIREQVVQQTRPGIVNPTTGKAGKPTTIQTRTGKKEYCLRVGPHELYMTGFRLPIGAPAMPDCIVDPSYDKIVALLGQIAPKTV